MLRKKNASPSGIAVSASPKLWIKSARSAIYKAVGVAVPFLVSMAVTIIVIATALVAMRSAVLMRPVAMIVLISVIPSVPMVEHHSRRVT
jgi:hypothetical protein